MKGNFPKMGWDVAISCQLQGLRGDLGILVAATGSYRQLRARWVLLIVKDVLLRTRRALSLYKVHGDSALLVLNWRYVVLIRKLPCAPCNCHAWAAERSDWQWSWGGCVWTMLCPPKPLCSPNVPPPMLPYAPCYCREVATSHVILQKLPHVARTEWLHVKGVNAARRTSSISRTLANAEFHAF